MRHPDQAMGNEKGGVHVDLRSVRSSFAGALAGAMRREYPPLTADEVSLLTQQLLAEKDVEDLLHAYRISTAEEVILIADVLGITLDDLLGYQRTTFRSGGIQTRRRGQTLVSMELRVTPEIRTALRLRKATTGTDIGDILIDALERYLVEELGMVRWSSKRESNDTPEVD